MEETYFTASIIYFVATVLLTGALVFITFKYARHTRAQAEQTKKMAEVLERDYVARSTPVIDFTPGAGSTFEEIEVHLHMYNYSQVLTTLTRVEFIATHKELSSKVSPIQRSVDVSLPPGKKEHRFKIHRHELLPCNESKYENLSAYQLAQTLAGKLRIWYSDNRGGEVFKERDFPR